MGKEGLDDWTSNENNCAITPKYPFFISFIMLLELTTLDGFSWITLSSISLPFEKNLQEKFLKIQSHSTPKTTSTPPIGIVTIGLSKK